MAIGGHGDRLGRNTQGCEEEAHFLGSEGRVEGVAKHGPGARRLAAGILMNETVEHVEVGRPGEVADKEGSTRRDEPDHFSKAGGRVGDVVNDRVGNDGLEVAIGVGQALGVNPLEEDAIGEAGDADVLLGDGQHVGGQVNGEDPNGQVGPAEFDRNASGAGADIEPLASPGGAVEGEGIGDEPAIDLLMVHGVVVAGLLG